MIISKNNPTFKYLNNLKFKKYRNAFNQAIVFGNDIVDIAYKKGLVEKFISTKPKINSIIISDKLFKILSGGNYKNKLGALVRIKNIPLRETHSLILEDVQDPRNLGAIIRSAHAFGFFDIYLSKKSVDPYHELSLRSSKGSIFDVSIKVEDVEKSIKYLKEKKYKIYTMSPKEKTNFKSSDKICLVLGNEGHGVLKSTEILTDGVLNIKTENVESLNVSAAAAIAMYKIRSGFWK